MHDTILNAIFIHGISPRAGTNYLRWVLACHRDVAVSPRKLWEFPHLRLAGSLQSYASALAASPKMVGVGAPDILSALGEGLLRLAHRGLPRETHVLFKEPSVAGIGHFFDYFPTAHLVILVRDGRDVSGSLARTRFGELPERWYHRVLRKLQGRAGTRAAHAMAWAEASREIGNALSRPEPGWRDRCTVLRYEDLVGSFDASIAHLLARIGLPESRFDWTAARGLAIKGSSFVGKGDPRLGLDWSGVDKASVEFTPVERWRTWPASEQRGYLNQARQELLRWGYPVE